MGEEPSDGLDALLVGLDGACFPVLEPMLEEGHLPNVESLLDRGAAGPLTSQLPPWTPSAWPSLYMGVNPGKHGAFDFLAFDGYDWEVVDRTRVREFALWELLDQRGLRSVVVNVPVTAPVRPFDGALVPGYVGPENPACHPNGLLDALREELDGYQVYKPVDLDPAERPEWYARLTRMRGRAFRYLVERFEPDFGFLQFQQTDTVFHEMPDDESTVREVFDAVDAELGAVVEACAPSTVLVVSDHGIGPYGGPEFRVNQYLRDAGLAESTRGEGGMPSWSTLSRDRRRDGDDGTPLVRRLLAASSAVGVTSQRLGTLLEWLGLRDFVLRHVSTETVRAGSERVDFGESTAYMRSRTEMGVRINLAGRDERGTVAPEDYAEVRESLVDRLSALTTPDGSPVFEAVRPADEVFHGPYIEEAVDVLTVPREFDVYLSASLDGGHFGDPSEPWNHKRDGLVVAAGEGIDADADLADAHLFDVAPTVLSLLDAPPSDRMDGRPLDVVEPVAPRAYPDFEPADGQAVETEQVERRLADLGYLEESSVR